MLADPHTLDNTWAADSESVIEWLERSTLPRAKHIRDFLNAQLSALPLGLQGEFLHNMRYRWDSGFFELIVARTIQLLGGEFEVEVRNADGRRPDFRARLPTQQYVIEAMSPKFDRETASQIVHDSELKKIIERNAPGEWNLLVHTLPKFDPSESRSTLKGVMHRLRNIPPPLSESDYREFVDFLPQGVFECTLIPKLPGSNAILGGPAYTVMSDSQLRILHALERKRGQTRAEHLPVILAIHASGVSTSLEDFDTVLFGHTVGVYGIGRQEIGTKFNPNGVFMRKSLRDSYAGVLAFVHLTPFGVTGPVLYIHPEFELTEPVWVGLERRVVAATGISRIPATVPGLREKLSFADPS